MTNQIPSTNIGDGKQPRFDLEERTARFGEDIIRFVRRIAGDAVTEPLIRQLVRAGTSVGANYCEADDAGSKKEFRYRISMCKRESRESKYWLRMMAAAAPELKEEARTYWKEAKELNLIFAAIYRSKKNG
ncbi:MAG: four helix bundle protein [Planctomycetaceae bacterium]